MDKEIAETYFSAMDRHFADFMVELVGEAHTDGHKNLWLASALVSRYVGRGHVCLNLPEIAGMPLDVDDEGEVPPVVCPGIDEWVGDLRGLSVVGRPGDFKPLVLDEKFRLYLYRYWLYEQQLARFILDRAKRHPREVDKELLAAGLKRLFPGNGGEKINWQGIAAILAVFNQIHRNIGWAWNWENTYCGENPCPFDRAGKGRWYCNCPCCPNRKGSSPTH